MMLQALLMPYYGNSTSSGPVPGEFGYKQPTKPTAASKVLEDRDEKIRTRQTQKLTSPGETDYLSLARSMNVRRK